MHPYRPDLEGRDVTDFTDPTGKRLFVACADIVRSKGAGYVDYQWQWLDNPDKIVPKISFVKGFEPWGWVVGTIDVDKAVRCMKSGAFDYIVKPVEESRLIAAIHQALKFVALHQENKAFRDHLFEERLEHPEQFEAIVTNSPAMLKLFRYIESVAPTNQPVLIRGETGVAKTGCLG